MWVVSRVRRMVCGWLAECVGWYVGGWWSAAIEVEETQGKSLLEFAR